jgi:hypothetical protein
MTLAAQAMPCGENDMQKDKLFAKIGELTVQFATLEHQLQSLLELLMAENSPMIGPFLIHELSLPVLLRKIKHIARYKLQGMSHDVQHLSHRLRQA